jgi:nucleotide-binding universal stress UspA family protein
MTGGPGPIVVGVDGSERSRDALVLARDLARAAGTRLLLVSVHPPAGRSSVLPPGAHAAAAAAEAKAALERVARPPAGVPTRSRAVAATSVTRGLHAVAEDEGALAIVVGPSHRGPVGHIVPGSVGERLLRGAPCPVAVAPLGHRAATSDRLRRIGVGWAATPEGDEALGAAAGLAARTGAAIRALTVVEPPPALLIGHGRSFRELERRAHDELAASAAHIAPGAEMVVASGYADDELARLSERVELLVCGSRGLGPLGRVMLGSVSTGVMRKARCPVLIVPRGAADGFAGAGRELEACHA